MPKIMPKANEESCQSTTIDLVKQLVELDELTRVCRGYFLLLIKGGSSCALPGSTVVESEREIAFVFCQLHWQSA